MAENGATLPGGSLAGAYESVKELRDAIVEARFRYLDPPGKKEQHLDHTTREVRDLFASHVRALDETLTRLCGGNLTNKIAGTLGAGGANALPFIPSTGGLFTIDNGSGGSDVGPFSTSINVPPPLVWSNIGSITVIDRSQPLTITWSGGDPAGVVSIQGGYPLAVTPTRNRTGSAHLHGPGLRAAVYDSAFRVAGLAAPASFSNQRPPSFSSSANGISCLPLQVLMEASLPYKRKIL
jgi:hypothetical protein